MLGWLFGGFVRNLERTYKDALQSTGREVDRLFDEKIVPLADKLDYVAKDRMGQIEELEDQVKQDIESLLNQTDGQIKDHLQTVDNLRENCLKDIRETNSYLENRINQISLIVMEALTGTQNLSDRIFDQVNNLEEKTFQDANQLVDKINEILEGKLEQVRNELKKYLGHGLPNPLDPCRRRLKLGSKPGARFSDMELYELTECYELNKLNENTPVDEVLKIYGQLQLNASRMAALVKDAPILRRRAIEDWIKYGILCEFWHQTIQGYDVSHPLLESTKPKGILSSES